MSKINQQTIVKAKIILRRQNEAEAARVYTPTEAVEALKEEIKGQVANGHNADEIADRLLQLGIKPLPRRRLRELVHEAEEGILPKEPAPEPAPETAPHPGVGDDKAAVAPAPKDQVPTAPAKAPEASHAKVQEPLAAVGEQAHHAQQRFIPAGWPAITPSPRVSGAN